MIFKRKLNKVIALFFLIEFTSYVFVPNVILALTSGPTTPEFSSFTPVATTDMVNLFTGDFNYNLPVIEIPGAEGGGYALSLSYNSGNTSEQEASWVGFGWSLNPGAINRSVRGFPDDSDGNIIDYYNKTRPNWTISTGKNVGLEAFSVDAPLGVSLSSSLRFNNYNGYKKDLGLGISNRGLSLNVNFDNDGATFSGSVNPLRLLGSLKKKAESETDNSTSKQSDQGETLADQETKTKVIYRDGIIGRLKSGVRSIPTISTYGLTTFSEAVRSTSLVENMGISYNWSASAQVNSVIPVGIETGARGSFNLQYNKYKYPIGSYGYMHSANAGSGDMMDYYTEKGNAYSKRDYFIGMPFSNYDIYSLSGEGLSGGFRSFNSSIGHYHPNSVESRLKIYQLGYEVMVGANLGVGVDFGIGSNSSEVDDWNVVNRGSFSADNRFRFNNDMGGSISYTNNSKLESGLVDLTNPVYGFRSARAIAPLSDDSRDEEFKLGENAGSSSFIEPIYIANTIVGFNVVNENGLRYSYDEPIYVRNETNLSIDVASNDNKEWRYLAFKEFNLSNNSGYEISDNVLNSDVIKTAIGEVRKDEFVNNFLLTSITTPDYIDKSDDGPSEDDFGGWTKFNYRKAYGIGKSSWYRYRTPYNGLLYQQNALSDTKDDIGSVSTGEKEVSYLNSIQTNTHIAYFVTNKTTNVDATILNGSGTNRLDGYGAAAVTSTEDPASRKSANGKPIQGNTMLEYLEKIVLFAKDINGVINYDEPIKVVNFSYDYSLVPNVPNNKNSTYTFSDNSPNNNSEDTGKLTLKKVWFEYGGIVPAKISPYVFSYEYKHSSTVSSEYEHLFSAYDNFSDNVQNPEYSPHLLSPWGYPMANGKERKEDRIPWIDQGHDIESNSQPFDPAAWQLKSIQLPSGGQILVQYEEKDYSHVQDKDVMAMSRVIHMENNTEFSIDPEDLGTDPTDVVSLENLVTKINEHFLDESDNESEKIYFKFLYALKGNSPSLDDCRSEYISGYTNFKSARLGQVNSKNVIIISLDNTGDERSSIPRQACFDMVFNTKQGKLDNSQCIESKYEARFDDALRQAANSGQSGDVSGSVNGLALSAMTSMATDPGAIIYDQDDKDEVCRVISPNHSFFKLPMIESKKGGGMRVKRLLMYDEGIENGDEAVYGSEYIYSQENSNKSSGVATTEPSVAREENPLVTFLPRKNQSWFSRITAGEDKEQTEGPIGESLLPAPSIGYSRVIVKNIHSGKTGTGYNVNEFYTVKDFPFDGVYGPSTQEEIDQNKFDVRGKGSQMTSLDDQKEIDFMNIPAGLFNYSTNKVWTAQGFRFILNSMHGQVKKTSNYGGNYISSANDGYLVSFQEYEYYKPGEKVRMMKWNPTSNAVEEYLDIPGKEMDIAMEGKRVEETTIDFSIEVDISVTLSFPPPIFVTIIPSFSHADNTIATHATTKVLKYPVILKSITNGQDGIVSKTENLAFGNSTGQPVLTKTFDSFHNLKLAGSSDIHDGSIYSLTLPAEWVYPSMGQKSINSSNTNQLDSKTATFSTYGIEPSPDWFSNPTNVLAANVQTFSSDWDTSWDNPKINDEYNSSAYKSELSQIWRPHSSFVYKADNKTSVSASKIYSSGYFDLSTMFNWQSPDEADRNWILTSEITKYSPDGTVLEERNALNIPSAVFYGGQYGNFLPTIIAQNSDYESIYFQDFENQGLDINEAHSGNGAKLIGENESIANNLFVTDQLLNEGAMLSLWIKFESGEEEEDFNVNINGGSAQFEKVAQPGDWLLYKVIIPNSTFNSIGIDNQLDITLTSGSGSFSQNIYVDDIRFQPVTAESTCYVYEPETFRLITQFDSEHFGLYYQYNDEGQLIRKIIETERGIKTIQETHYNTQTAVRY